jgi:diketogulonate reductase-like aldo/keto reductase
MFPLDDEGYYCADLSSHYLDTWHVMEQLVDEGLTRSIGLSNFNRFLCHVFQVLIAISQNLDGQCV